MANSYFLLIACISFTKYSPKEPVFSVAPLIFVLGVSVIKEVYEDYNRYLLDQKVNNSLIDIWNGNIFTKIFWKNLLPGDIIRVCQNYNTGKIPADILILQSSIAKGICSIETSNLDGETNLKVKQGSFNSINLNYNKINGDDYPLENSFIIESENPSEKMDHTGWRGTMIVNSGKPISINMSQMILRGCSLKNTDWIVGMVIFTGTETKLMLNNRFEKFKRSHMDLIVDSCLIVIFIGQFCGCMFGMIGHYIWRLYNQNDYWYMYLDSLGNNTDENPLTDALLNYLTFLVLLDLLVPISLYVSMELVKITQAFLINWDRQLWYLNEIELNQIESSKTGKSNLGIWAQARTSSLNDELGQISWIFSDKTGTITRNVMEFLNCYIPSCSTCIVISCFISHLNFCSWNFILYKKIIEYHFAFLFHVEHKNIGIRIEKNVFVINVYILIYQEIYEKKLYKILRDFVWKIQTEFGTHYIFLNRFEIHRNKGKRYGLNEMIYQNEYQPFFLTKQKIYNFRFNDTRLNWQVNNGDIIIDEFLTCLTICHSIVIQKDKTSNDIYSLIDYQASSPDEKALVIFAKNMYYFFCKSESNQFELKGKIIQGKNAIVRIFGRDHEFEIYEIINFTSLRKRMSVICKDKRDKKIKIYCKGADNIIFQSLSKKSLKRDWIYTEKSLEYFSSFGLRTLCLAYKILNEKKYIVWQNKLEGAKFDKNNEILIPIIHKELESNLTLLGVTAIEDQLQDGVSETIKSLFFAGINIWMITGDKVETAVNIGRSCHLLNLTMKEENNTLIILDIAEQLEDNESNIKSEEALERAFEIVKNHSKLEKNKQGLLLNGKILGFVFPIYKRNNKGNEILQSPKQTKVEEYFQKLTLKVCKKCSAVICCRASPKQKSQIVQLIKFNIKDAITLAIGDGANDVPMIRAAHVGIGIKGLEGVQALMVSDYVIGQFKFLRDLLFVHGSWNYIRLSKLILYSFYKNIVVSLTQLMFSLYSGYSGTLYYDPFASSCFNLIYTCWPILILATFDRPFTKDIARNCPELYEKGTKNLGFNFNIFFRYLILGFFHAFIIFFGTIYCIDSHIAYDGKIYGFWSANTTLFTIIVTVVTVQIMLETRLWMWCNIIWFFLSLISWFLFQIIWTNISLESNWENYYIYGNASKIFSLEKFWLLIFLILVLCILPELLYIYIHSIIFTTQENLVQELEFFSRRKYKGFLTKIKTNNKKIWINKEKKNYPPVEILDIGFVSWKNGNPIFGLEQYTVRKNINILTVKSIRRPIYEVFFKQDRSINFI